MLSHCLLRFKSFPVRLRGQVPSYTWGEKRDDPSRKRMGLSSRTDEYFNTYREQLCKMTQCWWWKDPVLFKMGPGQTSLVVQWLRLCASTAGGVGLIPGRGTKIRHAVLHSQKQKKARMICFPDEDRATMEALTSSCQVPCKGTVCGMLKSVRVLSKGLTLHFEITQIIYSENDFNWRIKKSEISNPTNLGLGFLDFIHISALELIGGTSSWMFVSCIYKHI